MQENIDISEEKNELIERPFFRSHKMILFILAIILAYLLGNLFPLISSFKPQSNLISQQNKLEAQTQQQNDEVESEDNQLVAFPQIISNFQSYAVVDNSEMVLVPISSDNQPIRTGVKNVRYGGGAWGYGNNEPISSPDMKKVAYIDSEFNLHVMSADGKIDYQVSNDAEIEYISGWSPDSGKLLVFSKTNTLFEAFFNEMQGFVPDVVTLSKHQKPKGFYLFDVATGDFSLISVFDEYTRFYSWIDKSKLSMGVNYNHNDEEFIVFDVDSYLADAILMNGELKNDFGTQYVFSQDGKKWALTWHGGTETTDSGATIVLADFPNLTGKELMKADFAYVQGPIISPDGNKVAFRGIDFVNGPNNVYYYDGQTVKKLFEGYPKEWISNTEFIYIVSNPSYATNQAMAEIIYLYNVSTGQSRELFKFSQE